MAADLLPAGSSVRVGAVATREQRRRRLDAAAAMDVAAWAQPCRFPRLEAVRAQQRMVSFLDGGIRAFGGAHGPMADAVPA